MNVRHLCVRQNRNLRLLSQTRILSSFSSTDTTNTTIIAEASQESLPSQARESSAVLNISKKTRSAAREAWHKTLERRNRFHKLGSEVSGAYDPEEIVRNPPQPSDVTLELLLASQSHLGHTTSRWNPQNSRYIFGIREGIHIISLDVTAAHLRRAAKVVGEVARRGGLILFVGTREGQRRCVVRAAELAKGYHLFERWIPGSLSNGQQILGHCEMKVVNALDEELPQFREKLVDHPVLKPDLVVCFNPIENEAMLHECGLNNIPTIGITDTDADPTRVTYPIPANDDSVRCVSLIAGVLGRAGEEGQRRRLEDASEGILTYKPITKEELQANPAATPYE